MLMHKDTFVTKWVVSIMTSMGDVCEEGFFIPMHALFYSEYPSSDILTRKRALRIRWPHNPRFLFVSNMTLFSLSSLAKQADRLKRIPWYQVYSRASRSLRLWWDR